MRDLTVDLLKHLFDYDKETGDLIWKMSRGTAKKGDVVGGDNGRGYLRASINSKLYSIHRLVFLMHKGYLPVVLDHIDGNTRNNRIENLRPASKSQNQHNRKIGKNNTSGFKGVYYHKKTAKFRARIGHLNKTIFLGAYNTPEEADVAVRAAREELHGSFANHGDQ
jgi:hypothetical protein